VQELAVGDPEKNKMRCQTERLKMDAFDEREMGRGASVQYITCG